MGPAARTGWPVMTAAAHASMSDIASRLAGVSVGAGASLPDDTITALAARTENTKLSMFAYGQGDVLEMPFSVNGFAEALSRMRDEAVDRAVAPAAE